MVGRPIFIEPHGDRLHVHAILEAKLICRERGYEEKDYRALVDKGMYPGIPDLLYIRIPGRRTSDHGKSTHDEMRYFIEIETDATAATIRKKRAQFDTSMAGHDLLVINLKELGKYQNIKLDDLVFFLEAKIP